MRGALKRATDSRRMTKADFGVGIEAGVHKLLGYYYTQAAVVIVDDRETVGSSFSAALQLPPIVGRKVAQGGEVGPIMDKILGKKDTKKKLGIVGYLTKGVIPRHSVYTTAVQVAYARFLSKEIYEKK